jgi:hypothetical protein
MRFIKISIFLLFLLSLLTAGVSLYLSTIRENEKEKRIYLEQVRVDLQTSLSALMEEKEELERQVTELEQENEALFDKFQASDSARKRAVDKIREKERELTGLRKEISRLTGLLSTTEIRNNELENVLDELESKIREMTSPVVPIQSETAYVGLDVMPALKEATSHELMEAVPPPPVQIPHIETSVDKKGIQKKIPKPKRRKWNIFSKAHRKRKSKPPEPVRELQAAHEKASDMIEEESIETHWTRDLEESVISDTSTTSYEAAPLAEEKETKTDFEGEASPLYFQKEESDDPWSYEESIANEMMPEEGLVEPPVLSVSTPYQVEEAAADEKNLSYQAPSVAIEEVEQPSSASGAVGKVLLVNRKFNFVVANLGTRQGLGLDDVLSIEQNGTSVGQVRIEKIYDDYSAAYIVEEQSAAPIEEGDLVVPVS